MGIPKLQLRSAVQVRRHIFPQWTYAYDSPQSEWREWRRWEDTKERDYAERAEHGWMDISIFTPVHPSVLLTGAMEAAWQQQQPQRDSDSDWIAGNERTKKKKRTWDELVACGVIGPSPSFSRALHNLCLDLGQLLVISMHFPSASNSTASDQHVLCGISENLGVGLNFGGFDGRTRDQTCWD